MSSRNTNLWKRETFKFYFRENHCQIVNIKKVLTRRKLTALWPGWHSEKSLNSSPLISTFAPCEKGYDKSR